MGGDIEKYRYLWDGTQPERKMVKEAAFPEELFIVNRQTGVHLHVDDPALKALCARMTNADADVEEIP